VRSKAERKSQLNLAHGTKNEKSKEETKTKTKNRVAQKKRSGW